MEVRPPVVSRLAYHAYAQLPGHGHAYIPGKIVGALRVVSGIRGALPLVHGPVGCSFQRKVCNIIAGPVFYHVPCTALSETEVVYGGEHLLRRAVLELYERHKPRMIVVLTTCTTDMIGDDVAAVVEEARRLLEPRGCYVVYSTGDFVGKTRMVGAQDVLFAIADQFVVPKLRGRAEKLEGRVNIQTSTGHGGAGLGELAAVLSKAGLETKLFFDGRSVDELLELGAAELNLTVSRQLWAEHIERELGVKHYYIFKYGEANPLEAYPAGIEGLKKVAMDIGRILGREAEIEEALKAWEASASETVLKLAKRLKGLRVAVEGGVGSPAIIAARDLGMNIVAVIYWSAPTLSTGASERVLAHRVEVGLKALRELGSEPVALVDPTTSELEKVLRRQHVDLVLTTRPYIYHAMGFRAVNLRVLYRKVGYVLLGVKPVVELAKLVCDALEGRPRSPITALVPRDESLPVYTPWWSSLVRLFNANRRRVPL